MKPIKPFAPEQLTVAALLLTAAGGALIAQQNQRPGYTDTPLIPGSRWRVHDRDRPHPRVIDPGTPGTQDRPGKPPSDAIVLFDGTDLAQWRADNGGPPGWKIENGALVVVGGKGSLVTRQEFGDCQLHIEWAAPEPPRGTGQGRGNSGVLLFGRYEVQVLDSYDNLTYADGQAAALYGQYPPLVNACRKPGEWQTYDILFTAPRFKDGRLEQPGYITVLHNGVVVHNHTQILGSMAHRQVPSYQPHGPRGPLVLQDHDNPVRYRNIWIRELKDYDQP